ncbi:glycoside hydrolase family 43 protein [Cellulosilyticum sp. I15G10I2]|uniref:glycoside hydrolase family 43 protein n=1 Tax=Cellulosilyticum sp. I15G10I2 TaxID=1892843 RepID=UPI00085BF473|nr:glycoside hydrolase family 43 protein [Cellulosilyticum sp. I15G10I2]
MIENPILKGFCPDPSIIRVGEDYYIATSTFEWWPGVKIHHSKDLKHWEQIPSPLRRMSQLNMIGDPTSGGIWAPCLSYDNGKFYLIYTDVKTKKGRYYNNHNYLIETEDIYGEWSDPIYLNSTGFDPSLFHDTDGKKYLVNMRNGFKGILVQEYDPVNKCLIGEVKNIFAGTEAGYTEGPHLYHIGEWYYLIVAEGGTGYGHCVTMARSKSIWGPYQVDPGNPMLTSKEDDDAYLQKCGHADFTDTQNGEWYMVHLCARPRKGEKACVLGRETAIQKVYWNEEGWLRLANNQFEAAKFVEEPAGIEEHPFGKIEERDDFEAEELDVRYVSPRIPLDDNADLTARKGYLRLYGQESMNSLHRVTLVALRQMAVKAEAELSVEFSPRHPEQLAGLTYMYDAMNFYILGKSVSEDGKPVLTLLISDTGVITELIEPVILETDERLYLKVCTSQDGKIVDFYYSYDGNGWRQVGSSCDTYILTDEHCRGFTGAHFGMYCHDMTGLRLHADFDYFIYR